LQSLTKGGGNKRYGVIQVSWCLVEISFQVLASTCITTVTTRNRMLQVAYFLSLWLAFEPNTGT
jgi:hypothetical protein